jgi:hypothetical protein
MFINLALHSGRGSKKVLLDHSLHELTLLHPVVKIRHIL